MIYTFYSYKGGVGRSMALANVAEALYRVGLRVVMVDWDLEAPGLESFFPNHRQKVLREPGLIDLLLRYKEQRSARRSVRNGELEAATPDSPNDLLIDVGDLTGAHGSLHLLSAGQRAPSFEAYATAIRAFDWRDFYANWSGEQYVDWLRSELLKKADVVLIDSRTGVTEIGGISTYQVADAIVLFTAPNQQNLEGTLTMARSFVRDEVLEMRRFRPLNILTVASRVDDRAETRLLNEFQEQRISETLKIVTEQAKIDRGALWKMTIPYVPLYAFYERVAMREVGPDRSDALREAYGAIVEAMARLAPQPADGMRDIRAAVSSHLFEIVANVGSYAKANAPDEASRVTGPGFLPPPSQARTQRPPCPYRGMAAFNVEDTGLFFGRSQDVTDLLQRLRHEQPILLIGPSGSGKTSLVFGGLIPALRSGALWPQDYWSVVELEAGRGATDEIAMQLGSESEDPDLARLVERYLAAHRPAQRLLFVVDPLEEIFTVDERERRRFLAALGTLQRTRGCTILATIRSDYLADVLHLSDHWLADRARHVLVEPLRGQRLRAAIEEPAHQAGVEVDPALLERLVTEVAAEPGTLPYLQETLVLLWSHLEGNRLTLEAYEALGKDGQSGLTVAIVQHAESVLAELPSDVVSSAERILLRLVQFGEGRPNTRRRQAVSALKSADDDPTRLDRTLSRLCSGRLIILTSSGDGDERYADLAHEALVTGWPRLAALIAELGPAEQTRRHLEDRAQEWQLGAGSTGLIGQVGLIAEVRAWLTSPVASRVGYSPLVVAFVEASERAIEAAAQKAAEERLLRATIDVERAESQRRAEEAAELAAKARMLAAAMESQSAEAKRAKRQNYLQMAASIVVVLVVAGLSVIGNQSSPAIVVVALAGTLLPMVPKFVENLRARGE